MINSSYLNEGNIEKIRGLFYSDTEFPSIKLQNFLDKDSYRKIAKDVPNFRYKKKILPMQCSYSAAKAPKILEDFLNSKLLKNFISKIIGAKAKKISGNLCSFGWKDYTLLHDKKVENPGFDLIIDFTEYWDEKADGRLIYTDGRGNYNYIHSSPNTLIVAHRRQNIQKFVQYINHYANKDKRYLFMGLIK